MFGRKYDELPAEIDRKNSLNQKIHGSLISDTTKRIFDDGWALLTQTAFDSQEADIIIAGMAIWGMAFEDMKYAYGVQWYPQHSFGEVLQICFGTDDASHLKREEIIRTIGRAALIDKKLDFDGTVSIFCCSEWRNRDWSEWTDRFDKYQLPVPPSRAEVLAFLDSSAAYKALAKMLPPPEKMPTTAHHAWKIYHLKSSMTIAELADRVKGDYLDKTPSCRNTTIRALNWAGGFFHNRPNADYYFIQLNDEINAYMKLHKIAGLKPQPAFSFL